MLLDFAWWYDFDLLLFLFLYFVIRNNLKIEVRKLFSTMSKYSLVAVFVTNKSYARSTYVFVVVIETFRINFLQIKRRLFYHSNWTNITISNRKVSLFWFCAKLLYNNCEHLLLKIAAPNTLLHIIKFHISLVIQAYISHFFLSSSLH